MKIRKKRTILGNREVKRYLSLPEYFDTADGKEVFEHLKANNPIVMIFLTKGGYVVDVEFKKFVDKTNGINANIEEIKKAPPILVDDFDVEEEPAKSNVEINPIFQRPADPIEHIEEPKEESDNEADIQIGDTVEWINELGVHYQDVVEGIDEQNKTVRFISVDNPVPYDKLVKIVI